MPKLKNAPVTVNAADNVESNVTPIENVEMAAPLADVPDNVTVTETPANVAPEADKRGPGRPKSTLPTVSGLTAAIKKHQDGEGALPEGMTYTEATIDQKTHFMTPARYESVAFAEICDNGTAIQIVRLTAVGRKFTPVITVIKRVTVAELTA